MRKDKEFIGQVFSDAVTVPVHLDRDSSDLYCADEWDRPVMISVTRLHRFHELDEDLREEKLDRLVLEEVEHVIQCDVFDNDDIYAELINLAKAFCSNRGDGRGEELKKQFDAVFDDDIPLYQLSPSCDTIHFHPSIPKEMHRLLGQHIFELIEHSLEKVSRSEIAADLQDYCWFSDMGILLSEMDTKIPDHKLSASEDQQCEHTMIFGENNE